MGVRNLRPLKIYLLRSGRVRSGPVCLSGPVSIYLVVFVRARLILKP